MSTRASTSPTPPGEHDTETVALAAEALLREHPDAQVCALASNGLIVPVPRTVGLWGQGLIEGRALVDNVVAGDRTAVVRLWLAAQQDGAAATRVRLLSTPSRWSTLHFLDLREIHGVLLGVILPSEDEATEDEEEHEPPVAAPRFCTLTEDEGARVIDCDPAFTQMFGFTLEEMHGKSVLDQIHPDDQGRAVEGWLSVLSTSRNQQTRLRRKRTDGSWMWVDTTLHNFLNEPGRNHVLVEIIDISAEMQAQEALADREELLRRLTNAMPVGLLHVNTKRRVLYRNQRLIDILHGSCQPAGEEADGELAQPSEQQPSVHELLGSLTEEGLQSFDAALAEVFADGVDKDVEVEVALLSGEERRALMSLRALLRGNGEVNGAIICVLDVTDSARARSELERRATFDPLTGCHNRSSILAALDRELAREGSAGIGAVYVDLDEFKPVNDRLGHAAGDELLVLVAERLRLASRDTDLIGRLGGDEFLVVLHDIPGPAVAIRVAERICESLTGEFALSCGTVSLRGSVGVACSHGESIGSEELVRRADGAMYESKARGEGRPMLAPLR